MGGRSEPHPRTDREQTLVYQERTSLDSYLAVAVVTAGSLVAVVTVAVAMAVVAVVFGELAVGTAAVVVVQAPSLVEWAGPVHQEEYFAAAHVTSSKTFAALESAESAVSLSLGASAPAFAQSLCVDL